MVADQSTPDERNIECHEGGWGKHYVESRLRQAQPSTELQAKLRESGSGVPPLVSATPI
jgi:hypothetical protein